MITITNRKQQTLEPSSPQWHEHRARCFNASEAPMMMNCFPNVKRSELLRYKATGEWEKEVSRYQQKIYDDGHEFEATARPWAEEILEQDLFQTVISADVNGLLLSASFDGLCIFDIESFEHKTLNIANVEHFNNGTIAIYYRIQMEQQLILSGAQRVLFMASNGDKETMRHMFYETDEKLRQDIIDGWAQFRIDLENYVIPDIVVKIEPEAIEALPAINVQIHGGISASNVDIFKADAIEYIGNINKELSTDKDFINAEETVKFLKATREKIKLVKQQALAQTADIEQLFNTLDWLDRQFQTNSASLDKLVKAEKENKKTTLCEAAKVKLTEFVKETNHRLKRPCIAVDVNFREVIKGKRTIASIQNEIDSALAEAKIKVTRREAIIQTNLDYFRDAAKDHELLFQDLNQIFDKDAETFTFLIDSRITDFKEAEKIRLKKELDDLTAKNALDEKNKIAQREREADQKIIDDKVKADKEKELSNTLTARVESLASHAISAGQNSLSLNKPVVKKKPSIEQVANMIAIKFCHKHGLDQMEIMALMEEIIKGYEGLKK